MAKKVLDANWTGSYTKPSPRLYPHQWNWDSGFIAIGYAHYNQDHAQKEIESLFRAQWPHGMVPQIVFNPHALGNYFPEPDFWRVPEGRPTSGITMPPLHATACLHIYQHARHREQARDFLQTMYPRLLASHRYLYKYRDPERSGLVYIRHPWESGLDNSPTWDGPLDNIEIDKKTLPDYERKDLKHGVPPAQRPSDAHYDRYVHLVDLFRRHQYDEESIYHECPFLIQDVLFNAVLSRANRDLVEIGKTLGLDTREVEEWRDQTASGISQRLWCSDCNQFEAFDLIQRRLIHTPTVAAFMPLFGGTASPSQAERLYNYLDTVGFCALHQGNCFTVPTYDMSEKGYDPHNYWRGPIWININWMLFRGLAEYGYKQKADSLKRDLIQLPIRFGFHEYFDSRVGKGYGSDQFSWTAALFIDLIYDYYREDGNRLWAIGSRKGRRLESPRILNTVDSLTPAPQKNIASTLMAAIVDLRTRYFDIHRGRVDYASMKESPEYLAFTKTTGLLRSFDVAQLATPDEKTAFWIDLYNALVIHGIVELNIKASVQEVANFFKSVSYQIGEFVFSLDDIEHGILRANARPPYAIFRVFKIHDRRRRFSLDRVDPRIHFAVVCGSRSCPPIRFYKPEKVDDQLNLAARHFVNSSEVIALPEQHKVFLSQIFRWYERDFGGRSGVLDFVLRFLDEGEEATFLKRHAHLVTVNYLSYDWNLNH